MSLVIGFLEGKVQDCTVLDLDYDNSLMSTVMDEARRFIGNEERIEKADTALVGLAAQLLDTGEADYTILLTTDKPAGKVAETLLLAEIKAKQSLNSIDETDPEPAAHHRAQLHAYLYGLDQQVFCKEIGDR